LNGVKFKNDFIARGIPVVNVNLKGKFVIGKRFEFKSGRYHNMIGRQQPCFFIVGEGAELFVGDNVGISATALICYNKIVIGNNVKIGGNVVIYDTDFHALDPFQRNAIPEITGNVKTAPVFINDGAFIGAHSTILKGVTIGRNAIIGACSVVVKNVPDGQIWAGNPARLIKSEIV
jgi:acetyltransferase-like isoleucine patch superfamily enzyme